MPVGLVHSASARDERLPHRVSGRFHGCVSPVKKHQEPGHLAPSVDNVQSRQLYQKQPRNTGDSREVFDCYL